MRIVEIKTVCNNGYNSLWFSDLPKIIANKKLIASGKISLV